MRIEERLGQLRAFYPGPDGENQPDTDSTHDDGAVADGAAGILLAITAAAEQAFMLYDRITEAAQDERVMLTAQALTQEALDRIDALVGQ